MENNIIMCNICAGSFDSNDNQFCKPCEFYHEGLKKFGKTKSNLDYQIEAGIKSLICMVKQI